MQQIVMTSKLRIDENVKNEILASAESRKSYLRSGKGVDRNLSNQRKNKIRDSLSAILKTGPVAQAQHQQQPPPPPVSSPPRRRASIGGLARRMSMKQQGPVKASGKLDDPFIDALLGASLSFPAQEQSDFSKSQSERGARKLFQGMGLDQFKEKMGYKKPSDGMALTPTTTLRKSLVNNQPDPKTPLGQVGQGNPNHRSPRSYSARTERTADSTYSPEHGDDASVTSEFTNRSGGTAKSRKSSRDKLRRKPKGILNDADDDDIEIGSLASAGPKMSRRSSRVTGSSSVRSRRSIDTLTMSERSRTKAKSGATSSSVRSHRSFEVDDNTGGWGDLQLEDDVKPVSAHSRRRSVHSKNSKHRRVPKVQQDDDSIISETEAIRDDDDDNLDDYEFEFGLGESLDEQLALMTGDSTRSSRSITFSEDEDIQSISMESQSQHTPVSARRPRSDSTESIDLCPAKQPSMNSLADSHHTLPKSISVVDNESSMVSLDTSHRGSGHRNRGLSSEEFTRMNDSWQGLELDFGDNGSSSSGPKKVKKPGSSGKRKSLLPKKRGTKEQIRKQAQSLDTSL